MTSISFKDLKFEYFRMPFKAEIKQFSTLTKRFQRDSAKIVNEIKDRIRDSGLTKAEIKELVEGFGKLFSLFRINII